MNLQRDCRHSVRALLRRPSYLIATALCLALGIGVNAVVFLTLYALLLGQPPGVRDATRVVRLYFERRSHAVWAESPAVSSHADFAAIRSGSRSFIGLAANWQSEVVVGSGEGARTAALGLVSGDYFSVLGLTPELGRFFTPAEDRIPGGNPVAVLAHGYWVRQFGSDSGVVGRSVLLGGHPFTIVGVAAPDFVGIDARPDEVIVPLTMSGQVGPGQDWLGNRDAKWLSIFGRLRDGATPHDAARESSDLVQASLAVEGRTSDSVAITLGSLNARRGPAASAADELLVLAAGATLAVLLISLLNVSVLLLARAAEREHEVAVRIVVGADARRIVREFLAETAVLALFGALLGGILAFLVSVLLTRAGAAPPGLLIRQGTAWRPFDVVLLLLAIAAPVALGIVPAVRASRTDIMIALKEGRSAGSRRRARSRAFLLATQVALALVLLASAGLFNRSARRAQDVDLGVDVERLVLMTVDRTDAATPAELGVLYRNIEDRMRMVPGVRDVALGQTAIFRSSLSTTVDVPSGATAGPEAVAALLNGVDSNYFAVTGMRLLAGRLFAKRDQSMPTQVAIISATTAKRLWPDGRAVGRCLSWGADDRHECVEVIGVVSDGKYISIRESPTPFIYVPLRTDDPIRIRTLYIRVDRRPELVAAQLERELRGAFPQVSLSSVYPLHTAIIPQLQPLRMGALLFSVAGATALLLSATGVFGLVTYDVLERTPEVGVRIALGARRRDVIVLVVKKALQVTAAGVCVGLLGAIVARRLLASFLFGIGSFEPVSLIGATMALCAVAVAAAYAPVRRATRIDPVTVLRRS